MESTVPMIDVGCFRVSAILIWDLFDLNSCPLDIHVHVQPVASQTDINHTECHVY